MILVIIGVWLAFLWILVKLGILKNWYLWMKLSPIAVWGIAMLIIFLPLNWTAPIGPVSVVVSFVPIKPGVSGIVTEVSTKSWEPYVEGDLLFQIDKEPFEAARSAAVARLELAQTEFERKRVLLDRGTGTQADLGIAEADLRIAQSALRTAEFELENTDIKAPFDGIVPGVVLRPGDRVSAGKPVMAFLDIGNPVVTMVVKQNATRLIAADQNAEVVFKGLPGQTFQARVAKVYLSAAHAEIEISGNTPVIPDIVDTNYAVGLIVDLKGAVLSPGNTGQAVILTNSAGPFGVIQRIRIRMTTWMNYFL